jgi:hypothetical protein
MMITDHNGDEIYINHSVFHHIKLDSGRYAIVDRRNNKPLKSHYRGYYDGHIIERMRTWEKTPIAKVAEMNCDFWSMETNRNLSQFPPYPTVEDNCHYCGSKLLKGDES